MQYLGLALCFLASLLIKNNKFPPSETTFEYYRDTHAFIKQPSTIVPKLGQPPQAQEEETAAASSCQLLAPAACVA